MIFTLIIESAEGFNYGDERQHNVDANNTGKKCARSSLIQTLQERFGYVLLCYVHKINGQLEQHEAGESVIHTAPHKEEGTHRRQVGATD